MTTVVAMAPRQVRRSAVLQYGFETIAVRPDFARSTYTATGSCRSCNGRLLVKYERQPIPPGKSMPGREMTIGHMCPFDGEWMELRVTDADSEFPNGERVT